MSERFREIRQREPKPGNEGLPLGARRFDHPAVNEKLEELHIREIEFYQMFGAIPGLALTDEPRKVSHLETYETEVSSGESETFRGQLHPQVEGYDWHRGIAFTYRESGENTPRGRVFLFVSLMQSWEKGGAPDPIVYVDGNIGTEEVLNVLAAYTQARQTVMVEVEAQIVP